MTAFASPIRRPFDRDRLARTARATAAMLAAALVLAACGGGSGEGSDAGDASGPLGHGGTSAIECQVQGYPCTWKEVAPAVIARSQALAETIDGQLVGRKSTGDAVAWLRGEEPDVVVQYDEHIVRFRIPGGRPIWVAVPGVMRKPPSPGEQATAATAAATATAPATLRTAAAMERSAKRPLGVVAPGTPGKRALVLAPFAYALGSGDTDAIAATLDATPGYEGRVVHLANRTAGANDVDIESFRSFGNYDVIHLDSHGWEVCHNLETGEPLAACLAFVTAKDLNSAVDLVEQDNIGVEVSRSQGETHLILTTDFFRHHYPGGLPDRLFYFDTCSPNGNAALAAALNGPRSAFFGWYGIVRGLFANAMAIHMFSGLQAGRRLQEVLESAGPGFVQPDGTHAVAYGDVRTRELIIATDAQTGFFLADGEPMLVSQLPGDGENDLLLLDVIVDGVEAALADKFILTVFVDGEAKKQVVGLADAEAIGDYRRRVAVDVPLGFDAKADQTLRLTFVVALPEGGTSQVEVSPKVDDPGKLPAEYEMVSHVHMPLIGGDRWMTAKVLWELEADQDSTKPYRYYVAKSGTLSWTHQFKLSRDKDDCTLTGSGEIPIQGGNRQWTGFRIDFTSAPTQIFGSASTPKVAAQIKGNCFGEDMVVETSVGGVYLNAMGVAIDTKGPFSGSYSTGTKLPSTIDWTFTPVRKKAGRTRAGAGR